jgi:hypothetical protein
MSKTWFLCDLSERSLEGLSRIPGSGLNGTRVIDGSKRMDFPIPKLLDTMFLQASWL